MSSQSRNPADKDIDPRLLAQGQSDTVMLDQTQPLTSLTDRMQRPYTPAPAILPDNTTSPPSVGDNAPATSITTEQRNAIVLFQQGVHDAARASFQELPVDLQHQLPQNPIQAFRQVLHDPSVVPALYRYDMNQSANRVATAWFPGIPARVRQDLPVQPLEAFQAVVLRLPTDQRPSAPTGPPIAQRVLQEQQESLSAGIQAGPPHYGLPPLAPRLPPPPQEVVGYNPNDFPLGTAESFEASYRRGLERLQDRK